MVAARSGTSAKVREGGETTAHASDAPEPEPTTELTEAGEQYVIPGCERDQARGPKQGKLWD